MSSSTPSSVLDLSNSDLFLPQKDTSEFIRMPRFEFLPKSSPIQSLEQKIEIKVKKEEEGEEEEGEEFLKKDTEKLESSSSSSMRGSTDEVDDGFRTPEKKIPIEQNCPSAPIKPKPTAVSFLTRKRKSSNVKFLFRFDLAKEIQESLLHQVHPNSQEFSRNIKKVRIGQ